MSIKIQILKDRLSTCTDLNMINHIKKIIRELEEESDESEDGATLLYRISAKPACG